MASIEWGISMAISGGCGVPGEVTRIPAQFLQDLTNTSHKILAHEFFKLRFGIFDEHGYYKDPIYPHFYVNKNKILPTVMTDDKLAGK